MHATDCLRIRKEDGQKALALIRKIGLLNTEFKIEHEKGYLYLPLKRSASAAELDEVRGELEFEACSWAFSKQTRHQLKLPDLLSDKVPPHILASLPHAIDFVGDIAILEIPPELEGYKQLMGEAILEAHPKVKVVLAKWNPVSGVYRLRNYEIIGGETRTKTVHREYGCIFHVDLAKAYFSPRLSYEHNRVASLVQQGETVVDMFAGIGPYSILIARKQEKVQVYAIDVNPDAFAFLKKNVTANCVQAKVTPILGDAKQIIKEKLWHVADRTIMNLPETAIEYVDVACNALKPAGGIIHYYQFADAPEPVATAKARLTMAVEQIGRSLGEILFSRVVRGVAPFTYLVVVDAKIK